MAADAFSDGVLALVCLALVLAHRRYNQGLVLAYGVIGVVAAVGALRYSFFPALSSAHALGSLLASVAAIPLLACSLLWQDKRIALHWRTAWLFLFINSAIGLWVAAMGLQDWWQNICAVAALLILTGHVARQRDLLSINGLLFVIAAFVVHSVQWRAGLFSTVQLLHYLLAIGFINFSVALSRQRSWDAYRLESQ